MRGGREGSAGGGGEEREFDCQVGEKKRKNKSISLSVPGRKESIFQKQNNEFHAALNLNLSFSLLQPKQ